MKDNPLSPSWLITALTALALAEMKAALAEGEGMVEYLTLALAPEHVNHVRARVDVWRKGYALLCDVDGELYVYAKLP